MPCLLKNPLVSRFTILTLVLGALLPFTSSNPTESSVESAGIAGLSSSNVLVSRYMEDVKLRYVVDSGVCETTPGVHQMSGYIDVGENMSMWFWFFEARHNPETAPFTLWINGGPGCSSMIGLFQENGPCTVNSDERTTTLNPYSWNNISNMIYIDQPIGAGFSYGTDTINSTASAAPFIWKAFQVLFESSEFRKFKAREFIFSTESYGGHFAPAFISYFNQQNQRIEEGSIKGEKITVSALMINNGWYDPLIQFKSYIDFAANAPGYGPLQSPATILQINSSFHISGGCKEQLEACYKAGKTLASNQVCSNADDYCNQNVFSPAIGDLNVNDLRQKANSTDIFPYSYYINFLLRRNIRTRIGADVQYQECSDALLKSFVTTGDDARTFLPALGKLTNSGLKTLIWAGDSDIK